MTSYPPYFDLRQAISRHLTAYPILVAEHYQLTFEEAVNLAECAILLDRQSKDDTPLDLPDCSQTTVAEVLEYLHLADIRRADPGPYPVAWSYDSTTGDLLITRDSETAPADLQEAVRALTEGGRFEWVEPAEIGIPTSVPMLASEAFRDDAGNLVDFLSLYQYRTQIDPLVELMETGMLVFTRVSEEPDALDEP